MEAITNNPAITKLQNLPGDESKTKRNGTTLILKNVIVLGKLKVSRLEIII
jgi:hypothetical protein